MLFVTLVPLTNTVWLRYPAASMDMNRIASLSPSHGHEFQPANKLIMVRKTEQRTFASGKEGETPTLKTVTRTTVQTFDGNNKVLRKVTSQKKDNENGVENDCLTSCSTPRTPIKKSVSGFTTPKKAEPMGGSLRTSRVGSKSALDTPRLKERQQNGEASKVEDFATQCLQTHNEYRRLHGVPELRLDKKLCKYSQEWAEHLAKVKNTCHKPNSTYGENIFFFWSSNPRERVKGNDPVDNWYKEIEKHTFGVEPKTLKSGHMTQVLWKTSQRLGVGVARNVEGQTYVVCNYDPAGNYVGTYSRNVPPVGGFTEEDHKADEDLSDENFVHQALRLHNEYRTKHSVGPLQLNAQLSAFAQDWARTLARTRSFHHRPNNPYGENIFAMKSSDPITAADACRSWYAESEKYHPNWYGQEPARLEAGHFTQMVWRESELLGIGRAIDDSGQVIVVANYQPRGNVISRFGENVLKPKSRK